MKVLNVESKRRRNRRARHIDVSDDAVQLDILAAQPVVKLHWRQQQRARPRDTMREQVPFKRLNVLPEGILPVDKIALVVHPNVRQHHRDQREYCIFAAGA